jgi:hypothetical protein
MFLNAACAALGCDAMLKRSMLHFQVRYVGRLTHLEGVGFAGARVGSGIRAI